MSQQDSTCCPPLVFIRVQAVHHNVSPPCVAFVASRELELAVMGTDILAKRYLNFSCDFHKSFVAINPKFAKFERSYTVVQISLRQPRRTEDIDESIHSPYAYTHNFSGYQRVGESSFVEAHPVYCGWV